MTVVDRELNALRLVRDRLAAELGQVVQAHPVRMVSMVDIYASRYGSQCNAVD